MKLQYSVIFILLLLSVGCLQHKWVLGVSVEMEQIEIQECEKLCHRLKISICNLTGDSIFLPSLYLPNHLFFIDKKGKEYSFHDIFEEEISFYWKHVKVILKDSLIQTYDGQFPVEYSPEQLIDNWSYGSLSNAFFASEAVNSELHEFIKKYNLYSIVSSDCAYLESRIKEKYQHSVFLLPNECIEELFDVNTVVGKGYKVYFKYKYFNKKNKPEKIKLLDSEKTIEIRSDCPNAINGWKLFEGVIQSIPYELK